MVLRQAYAAFKNFLDKFTDGFINYVLYWKIIFESLDCCLGFNHEFNLNVTFSDPDKYSSSLDARQTTVTQILAKLDVGSPLYVQNCSEYNFLLWFKIMLIEWKPGPQYTDICLHSN